MTDMQATENVTSCGAAHFAVLPDAEASRTAARRLAGPRVLRHPSGRPWLVGRWPDAELRVAGTERARIVLIGCCLIDQDELTRHAIRLRDLADLDRLARRLPGSFHLIAALDDSIRVQGSAAGLRLVFHTLIDGTVVAADRADLLATAIGAAPDESQLAVRLLWPVPHPLVERPMWRGINAVPPGSALIATGGRARLSRWWQPPRATRSIGEAASEAREALSTAVDARVRRGVVSCDLSGGLDSTSICFLAAETADKVIAST